MDGFMDDHEKEAWAKLLEAIRMIDDYEKADFLHALQYAPHMAMEKYIWLGFLRFTNFNYAAAAQGVVKHWRRRRQVFKEKWLLPITICGNGAMSTEAIELWKTFFTAHLPKDSQGRSVACYDFSRKEPVSESSVDNFLQSLWYNSDILSRNPKSNTEGFVLLILLTGFKYDSSASHLLLILRESFPIRANAWHMFNCIPRWRTNWLLRSLIGGFERVYGSFLRSMNHHFYTSQQRGQFVEIMEMHGISKEGLPRVLGGTWSYDYGRSFVSSLEREERMRYAYFYGGTTSTTVATDVTECVPVPDEAHSVEEVQQLAQDPLIQSWKAFMEQTLKHEIPDEDKEAYLEAAESIVTSSDIRNRETNIDWFLQAEDFHSIYAAKRYVRYWQLRSETFGPNRFKPLHQTGEGALGRIELNVLATTFLTLLPSDAMGRPVLSIDSSMLKTGRSARDKGRDRCLFYMFSILAENEQCRRSGVVVLFRMESQFLERIDIAYLARIAHSLPLHMEAFHIVSSTPVPASLKTAINFCDQVFVHDTGTWEEITTNLEKFGMRKENLPKYIGGGYGLAKILQWQELRTRLEFQLPLGMSAINTSISDVPGMGPYTELSVEDKTERRRRFNVLNCRRKRDRIRIERELLEEECANLVLEREQLRNQNLALLELVFKANTIAQQAEEASSRTQSGNDSILSGLGTTTATDGALAEFSSAPGEIPDTSMHTAISGLLGLNSNT